MRAPQGEAMTLGLPRGWRLAWAVAPRRTTGRTDVCCLLPDPCLLSDVCCLLPDVCLLSDVCCLLPDVCLLSDVCCLLPGA